jgi:hypothetical protein
LVENKFKQVYIKIINKHRELNEEINQQVRDAKQAKTWFLRIHFSANYVNFYILCDNTNSNDITHITILHAL